MPDQTLPKPKKKTKHSAFYLVIALFPILPIIVFIISLFFGEEVIFDLTTLSNIDTYNVVMDTFRYAVFDLDTKTDLFLVFDRFAVSDFKIIPLVTIIFTFFFFTGLVFLASAAVRSDMMRFAVIISIVIGCFVLMKTELLHVFGAGNRYFLAGLILFFGFGGLIVQRFRNKIPFFLQLLFILIITATALTLIAVGSNVNFPLVHINNYVIPAGIGIAVLFIFLTADEPTYGILYVTLAYNTGKRRLVHFILLNTLWFALLIYLWLANTGQVRLDLFPKMEFFLLALSGVAGIWGLSRKKTFFNQILPDKYASRLIFSGLAVIAFSVTAYAEITANDPLSEALEDVIVYAFIGKGFMFLLGLLISFGPQFFRLKNIHQLVYRSKAWPYSAVLIGAVALAGIVIIRQGLLPYRQAHAGYYNGLGDVYFSEGDDFTAETYYLKAMTYDDHNRRSNLSLAVMASKKGDFDMAARYSRQSLVKNPSEYAYLSLSEAFQKSDNFFDAFFTLQEGVKAFPNSTLLNNNLGLAYRQMNIIDSAFYHFRLAINSGDDNVAAANLYAAATKHNMPISEDNISDFDESNTSGKINQSAYRQTLGQIDSTNFSWNSDLNSPKLFFKLYNKIINRRGKLKQNELVRLNEYQLPDDLSAYFDHFEFIKAVASRASNGPTSAVKQLDMLQANNGPGAAYYCNILGLWLTEQEAYAPARYYFDKAVKSGNTDALINLAFCLSETGQLDSALTVWYQLAEVSDQNLRNIAVAAVKTFLAESPDLLNDFEKYFFIRYRSNELNLIQHHAVLETFTDSNLRTAALVQLADHYFEQDDYLSLSEIINKENFDFPAEELAYYQLVLAAEKEEIKKLKTTLKNSSFSEKRVLYKPYFEAVLAVAAGDNKAAAELFEKAVKQLPFDEKIRLKAADFFLKTMRDNQEAYEILLAGIELNRYTVPLYEAYTLQCLRMNLTDYAEFGLEELQKLASPKQYNRFLADYERLMKDTSSATGDWQ